MRRSTSLKAKVLIVVGVMALAPVAPTGMGVAQAHQYDVPSTVTINKQGRRFFGSVSSPRRQCMADRNVTLVKIKKNGRRKVVGRDTTGRHGNWAIRTRKKGRFQAVLSGRTRAKYGHNHVCRGDRSPRVRKKRRG